MIKVNAGEYLFNLKEDTLTLTNIRADTIIEVSTEKIIYNFIEGK